MRKLFALKTVSLKVILLYEIFRYEIIHPNMTKKYLILGVGFVFAFIFGIILSMFVGSRKMR